MTFDDFWEIKGGGCTYDIGKYIWNEAQKAERERAKELVEALTDLLELTFVTELSPNWQAFLNARAAIAKYEGEK